MPRARIETEARAYRNADAAIRDLRYGRVLGLLDAGGDTWALIAA